MKIKKIIDNLSKIEQKVGYNFENKHLLIQVFLHSSMFNNYVEITINDQKYYVLNNERLEFLGDGILNYLVSEYVYNKYPTFSEDSLSSFKTLLVNYYTLYKVCLYLDLQEYLVFNYESLGKNSANIKNFADIVEALIGAIYIDSKSIDRTRKFFYEVIIKVFNENLEEIVQNIFDWKGFLQAFLQKKGMNLPKYYLVDKNEQGFFIVAYFNGVEVSSGFGKTKKEAEKQAALNFFKKIFL